MKKKIFILAWTSLFLFILVTSAEAILWPPHRVGGTVTVTGGGTLDGCTAVLSSGGSQSVSGGSYMFNIPIYDADDNPSGISIGTSLSVSIKKDGSTLASDSFIVEAGGTTRIDFTVNIEPEPDPDDVDDDNDGYTENQGDCNDENASINPGATEICGNNIDENCDGVIEDCPPDPNDVDDDGDGYTENEGDCNDANANINPGATEICGDGIDQNCDGVDAECPPDPLARTGGIDFTAISTAYENVINGDTIFIKGDTCIGGIQEPLVFNRSDNPTLKLLGGCNCSFVPSNGSTTLSPSLTIVNGSVIVEAIIIR